MKIEELKEQDCAAWDTYVHTSPAGLPQHLSGWRSVLRNTYGYETRYLLARCEQAVSTIAPIVGVMPLFFVKSLLTGHTAMTMPGGLCADNEIVAQALLARGWEIARQAQAQRFVVQDSRQQWPGPIYTTSQHVHWLVDVRMGEAALSKKLDRNIRRQIRMARDNQLRAEIDRTPRLLGDFYDVFSRFTHQSGTPVFGRHFLEQVIEQFPHGYNIVIVYKEQQPIGGYFQLEAGKTNYGVWGATLPEYLALRPVYLAYWEILIDTMAHQLEFLDMGRSPVDSNASNFKRQWGGICAPIYQQIASEQLAAQSLTAQTQTDGKFQTFRQIWPKVPFPIAQFLGPKLRRHIPFA